MIGKIYKCFTPYYDSQKRAMSMKSRPALVLAKADADDYIVLPVSTITHKENIDPYYDIEVDPALYPKLNFQKVSYIRTHKQTVVNRANLGDEISTLCKEYEDLYLEVLTKREEFSKNITEQALAK